MASVGVLTMELQLPYAHSLKDKRQVVRGLKDRLRRRFNVAVAEIDFQETWQRSVIAAVTVSPDRGYAESLLQMVENEAADFLGPQLVSAEVVWLD